MANESLKSETFICESLIFKTLNIVSLKFVGVKFVCEIHRFEIRKVRKWYYKIFNIKILKFGKWKFEKWNFKCESSIFKTLNTVSLILVSVKFVCKIHRFENQKVRKWYYEIINIKILKFGKGKFEKWIIYMWKLEI